MKKNRVYCILCFIGTMNIAIQAQNTSINDQRNASYINGLTSIKKFYDPQGEKQEREHASQVMQCIDYDRNEAGISSDIYDNPLLLNGKSLDYGKFYLGTEGLLTVVKGNPETAAAKAIPFYIQIKRNGKIINTDKMLFSGKALQKIQLSEIYPFCKNGDMLIIKPVNAEDWKAKKILKLIEGC
jgi:hypothetical protein